MRCHISCQPVGAGRSVGPRFLDAAINRIPRLIWDSIVRPFPVACLWTMTGNRFEQTREENMMSFTELTLTTIALSCLAVALPANNALAQERLAFKVGAENTKYTQQHAIDVGDVSGHRVRLFEIHRTYPSKAPEINGMKIVESWSRGISDYTNNNGEAITYGVYVLENGDKFFTRGTSVTVQSPESSNLTVTTVGPIMGGTGKLARINGMARMSTLANPSTGLNETQVDLEYWLPQ
jgi:hypothetical protein